MRHKKKQTQINILSNNKFSFPPDFNHWSLILIIALLIVIVLLVIAVNTLSMEKKITYLIGAGASAGEIGKANGMPIVNQIPKELETLSDGISGATDTVRKLKQDLKWLSKEVSNQHSIDTLARQFELNGSTVNLRKLKILLSLLFYYKEGAGVKDKRYDQFFAALLSKDDNGILTMPSNINIISWNYDCQFEISFNNYTLSNDLNANQKQLSIINKGDKSHLINAGFNILKINGTAQFLRDGSFMKLPYFQKEINQREINMSKFHGQFTTLYNQIINSPETTTALSFAWEKGAFSKAIQDVLKTTDILVVIGYSFPSFNRQIDTAILSSMITNLEKVYVQDTSQQYPSIQQKLQDILLGFQGTILHQSNLNEFHIPHEFFSPPESDKLIAAWI